MLQKVIDLWKATDFRLVPHTGSNMVIVAAADDILAQLEESQVTIGTIRGSRYVTPIKVRTHWLNIYTINLCIHNMVEILTFRIFALLRIPVIVITESEYYFRILQGVCFSVKYYKLLKKNAKKSIQIYICRVTDHTKICGTSMILWDIWLD